MKTCCAIIGARTKLQDCRSGRLRAKRGSLRGEYLVKVVRRASVQGPMQCDMNGSKRLVSLYDMVTEAVRKRRSDRHEV